MAGNILNAQKFFENGYGYSTTGGIGLSTNASGQRLIDCSGLVYQMARAAGYNVPRFGTGDLLDANGNIKPGASRFYQPVDKTDLQPGDILVFAPDGHTSGHVGVVQEGSVRGTVFTGDFFGAQNTGGIRVEKVGDNQYWNTRTVLGVIRPRADRYDPALDQTGHNEVQLTPTAINSVTLAKQVTHLTDREFDVYKEAVASIEAKGHENNPSGWTLTDKNDTHWGRYQMGKDALIDAGFMDRRGNWIKPGIDSKEAFLNSPEAQDEALRNLADKNADWAVKNNYDLRIGETLGGNEVTKIGLLMSEHHERGSTAKFMNSDGTEDKQDANGIGPAYYLAAGARATKEAGLGSGEVNAGASPTPFTPSQDSPLTGQPYPRDPYPGDGIVTRNPDGTVTYSGTAAADSPLGIFFKGDRTSQTYDTDGKLIDVVIYDKTTDLPRERFSADTPVESLEAATYLGSDGAEYLYTDGLFVNIATGESRETLPAGPSQILPAKITSWNIPQADNTTILYEPQPGGGWKLTHRDADGQLIDTTQSLTSGGWIKTDSNGNALDGYAQDGTPFENQIAASNGNDQSALRLDENGLPIPEVASVSTQDTADLLLAALLDGYQQGSQAGHSGGIHYADVRGRTDVSIGEADSETHATDISDVNPTPPHDLTGSGLDLLTDATWEPDVQTGTVGEATAVDSEDTGEQTISPSPSALASAQATQSVLNLIQSLESGNALGILTNGVAAINHLSLATGGPAPLGDAGQNLGLLGSGLNLIDALENGNTLGAISAATSLGSQVTGILSASAAADLFAASAIIDNAATVTTGMIDAYNGAMSGATQLSNLSQGLGGAASIVGLALAIENGDPVGIAASTLSTLAAFQIIPVWGQIAAIALTVLDALIGEDEPPEILGHALAGYDEDGRLVARIDPAQENRNDGANTAVNLLQNLLDGIGDTLPEGYALVPQRLPEIGYHSQYRTQYLVENPDGTYRHFDSGQSDQIGQGYLDRLLAAQALVPEYEARTIQARIEHGDADAWKVDASGGHPQISEDGQSQTLSALTLTLPGLTTHPHPNLPPEGEGTNGQVWFDSDGDGYLERTGWIGDNQALLAIDRDGDGRISGQDELLTRNSGHNSLTWLDANGDGQLDQNDPAYAAIRVWHDINGDGQTQEGELTGLETAGVAAIGPDAALTRDGQSHDLQQTELDGTTQGETFSYDEHGYGILHATENGPTELIAGRTHDYTGEAGHTHGGEESAVIADTHHVRNDEIRSAGNAAAVLTHAAVSTERGDHGIQDNGWAGAVLAGQKAGQSEARIEAGAEGLLSEESEGAPGLEQVQEQRVATPVARSAPPEQGSVQGELRRITRGMLRESGGLFLGSGGTLIGLALGAAAQAGDLPGMAGGQSSADLPDPVLPRQTAAEFSPLWRTVGQAPSARLERVPGTVDAGQEAEGSVSGTDAPITKGTTEHIRYPAANNASAPAVLSANNGGGADGATPEQGSNSGQNNGTQASTEASADSQPTLRSLTRADISAAPRPAVTVQPDAPETVAADAADTVVSGPEGEGVSAGGTPPAPLNPAPVGTPSLAIAQPCQAVYIPAAPLVADESADGEEDQPVLIDPALLLENDLPGEAGRTLHLAGIGGARHGTVELDADGNILFTPEENYAGAASFQYTVEDSGGLQTQGRFVLDLVNSNDAPTAVDEETGSDEDAVLRISAAGLLANDLDPDLPYGDSLVLAAIGNVRHGQAELDAQGDILFTPEADYYGDAGFDYTITDSQGETARASATIHLAAVEDAPRVASESLAGEEDRALQFTAAGLLANDRPGEAGRSIHLADVVNARHGTVELAADGQITFTPDENYHGAAGFDYGVVDDHGLQSQGSVDIEIAPVNDIPVAAGEELDSDEDIPLLFNRADLLANDSDVDLAGGDALAIGAITQVEHGSARIDADGNVLFTPEADYYGDAAFGYAVTDSAGASATARVQIHLAPVNDAPRGDVDIAGREDQSLIIDPAALLAQAADAEGDAITLSNIGSPSHGRIEFDAEGQIHFTPDANYHGEAGFSYILTDANGAQSTTTAHIGLASVNDLPQAAGESVAAREDEVLTFSRLALLANESDVETAPGDMRIASVGNARHGTVQLTAEGDVRFTPQADYAGQAGFDYTVADGDGGLATAEVNIALEAVNDAPRLQGETLSILENTTRVFSSAALLANDADPDNAHADLAIIGVQGVSHGQASLGADGAVTFIPDFNFTGYAGFTYTVSDGEGGVSQAATLVSVVPPNQAPVVNGEIVDTKRAASVVFSTGQLLGNDWDPDGDALSIVGVGGANNGSVSMSGGSIVFTPVSGTGPLNAGFTYNVADGNGAYGMGSVALNLAMNLNPVAVDDGFAGYEDISLLIAQADLLANDRDSDNPHGDLRVTAVGGATNGNVSLEGGNVRFTPTANYFGAASFSYTVGDGEGGLAQAVANITINSVNDAPIIDSVSYNTSTLSYIDPETGATVTTLSPNQTGHIFAHDPDGNSAALRYELASSSAHGHENSLNTAGDWRYESQGGDSYNGPDSFSVRVVDEGGAFTTTAINVTHVGSSGGGGKPVTLDLDGNGLQFTGLDDSRAYFDINGDGWRDHMAWVAANDALLVLDSEGDRVIDQAGEISFVGYEPGASTDLEGLRAFDSNGDGRLDQLDQRWGEFGAWRDGDGDGVTDEGEFQTLDEAGIADIGLESDHQAQSLDDVVLFGQASFTRTDGSTGAVGDVMFRYEAGEGNVSGDFAEEVKQTETVRIVSTASPEEQDDAGLNSEDQQLVAEEHDAVAIGAEQLVGEEVDPMAEPGPDLVDSAVTEVMADATEIGTASVVDAEVARLGLLFTQMTASATVSVEPPLGTLEIPPANDAVFPPAGEDTPLPLAVGA